jgi:hypothetical protein
MASNSLVDALGFALGKRETMHETLSGIVGFLRIFDFAIPCSGTGR